MTQQITTPNKYWAVRKPDEEGAIVLKYTTVENYPKEIPDSCVAISVASKSALHDMEVDQSVLTEHEKEILSIDQS